MTAERLRIESLSGRHVPAVARLHSMALTRDFTGWAGRHMVALFYRELIASHDPPPGFVALAGEHVVGFAVAVANARAIKRRVAVRWGWYLAPLALVHLISAPGSLLRRLGRWWQNRAGSAADGAPDPLEVCCPPPRIEFRGIVVDPAAHVPGAALALMKARLSWAKAAGYRSIYFRIEPDNIHSIKLCQWAGAQPVPGTLPGRQLRFYKVL